ncbi:hypothetical protein MHBO_002568 [Bonamia ostreae]|uniref:Uncharacterized protein n=1 Tax=Bonamia ostreae TaxID=126728 RepID=A0ABV2AMS1_9EUKA
MSESTNDKKTLLQSPNIKVSIERRKSAQVERLRIEETSGLPDPERELGFKDCEIEQEKQLSRRRKSNEIEKRLLKGRKEDPTRDPLVDQILQKEPGISVEKITILNEKGKPRRKTVCVERAVVKKGRSFRRLSEQ